MERFREFLYGLPTYLLSSVASVLTVAQIILAFSSLAVLRTHLI